jgi:hypothetical protein
MRHFQFTAIQALAMESEQSRRAAWWRAIGYLSVILPFLLMIAFAGLRPEFNRSEAPDWRPVIAGANAALEKGDLYEARYLYGQVDQIASWKEEWEGHLAAACGLKRLDDVPGPYSRYVTVLLRAAMIAENKQSRRGMVTIAQALRVVGKHDAASRIMDRIRSDWPEEMEEPADTSAPGCFDVDAGALDKPRGSGKDVQQE